MTLAPSTVIPAQAGTHGSTAARLAKTWMPGSSPGKGNGGAQAFPRGSEVTAQGVLHVPADVLLAEELAGEDIVEMANLTSAQTGVSGTILISTVMGGHGPGVKYFVRPGRTQPSFSVSIADPPAVVANRLPARLLPQMAPQVIQWVALNRGALLESWTNGDTWTQPEVNDFIQRLLRL